MPSIIQELNERYKSALVSSSLQAAAQPSKGGLGKLKYLTGKGYSSTPELLDMNKNGTTPSVSSISSIPVSPPSAIDDGADSGIYKAEWAASPVVSFIIGGGAFGHGLFELIFALLPPKGRKLFSWLGYGAGNRKKALKVSFVLESVRRQG